ncbi:hypothetical protein E2C01_011989 [Portunus trituberculatus]|uniref:Uncharacterized protein n=1 Tax=Portunus trituberculatus TaxID=210409 RepID=A0A5B7DCQ9_PORTR|nr:hypothetical protein [Portunus trituberculatus]
MARVRLVRVRCIHRSSLRGRCQGGERLIGKNNGQTDRPSTFNAVATIITATTTTTLQHYWHTSPVDTTAAFTYETLDNIL